MKDVRLVAVSSAASQTGDWASRLLLGVLLFQQTGSAVVVGVVSAAFLAAWLGPGQWLTHRVSNGGTRPTMVRTEILRAGTFAAVAAAPTSAWILAVVVTVAAFTDPVFEVNRSAFIVEIAEGDRYAAAVKLLASVNQTAQLVGFLAGGTLIVLLPPAGVFAVIAGLFCVSAGALAVTTNKGTPIDTGTGSGSSVSAARQFFGNDPLSFTAMAGTVGVAAPAMAVEAIPPVAAGHLGHTGVLVGILAAALPAATLVFTVIVPMDGTPEQVLTRGVRISAACSTAAAVLFWFARSPVGWVAAYGLIGAALIVSIAGNVVVGLRIPATDRARVFGVVQGVLYGSLAAGAAAGGVLAAILPVPAALTAAAATAAVAALLAALKAPNQADPPEPDEVVIDLNRPTSSSAEPESQTR